MIFYLLLILLVIMFNLHIGNNDDYMSIEKTTCIKGIFILFVFYRHIASYVNFNGYLDNVVNILDKSLSQLIVTMFLFYSGYGVFEAIKRKREKYINSIPIQRVLKVLIEFDISLVLFWIIGVASGEQYGFKKLILTFIGWDLIGNSNWYIFCILVTYIFTYISFKIYKNGNIKAIIGVTILSLLYIWVMSKYKENYWYNTILCYPAGMWFSKFKENIEKLVLKSKPIYLFSLFITIE